MTHRTSPGEIRQNPQRNSSLHFHPEVRPLADLPDDSLRKEGDLTQSKVWQFTGLLDFSQWRWPTSQMRSGDRGFTSGARRSFILATSKKIWCHLSTSVHTSSAMSFSPLDIPTSSSEPFTDYSRWRLVVDEDGRHSWTYLRTDEQCTEWPQKPLDKFWMGLPTVRSQAIGFFISLTLRRNCPICRQRKRLSNQHEMATNTTNTFKPTTVTGPENTVDPCSSSQASSSDPTSLGHHLPTKNATRSFVT